MSMKDAFKKFDLSGKTALVTGGGTGIGYEMSKALALSGARVMIAARRESVLREAADRLNAELAHESVLCHPVDLSDRHSVKALAGHASATLKGVDIFIGNAGFEVQQRIDDLTDDAIDPQIRVNLTANIELTRAFLPHMREKRWGRVIYSSSAGSQLAGTDDMISVYGAAKSGINGFVKYVAAEGGYHGITANALILGMFQTDMAMDHLAHLPEDTRRALLQAFSSMVYVRRLGLPEEIGGLIQLLASDAGSYITATCIPVDGGFMSTMRPSTTGG